MPFIPHTSEDIQKMLATIGVNKIEQLFDEIPTSLIPGKFDQVPEGLNELAVARLLKERQPDLKLGGCFIGAGAYEHHIPAAIWEVTTRGEFYTAYTPYQAEASQGSLQLIYEYQTMMASLMAMDVSNASLYDGASALAEAALMAVRIAKNDIKAVLVPESLHPFYRQVLISILKQQNIEIVSHPFDLTQGIVDPSSLNKVDAKKLAAIIIPQPNFFGCLEEVDALTNWAHSQGILAIGCVNPTAMALLKPPGQWGEQGVDIVCGEGQPLGVPLASGGPYFGFMCCKKAFVRQLPGRIVGRTVDGQGREGYTLTLQAREQHIRRSKATSNICTNQGLVVVAATIYMSLLGPQGLREVAVASHQKARELLDKLTHVKGITRVFSRPFFHEFVIRLNRPAEKVLADMADLGIQAGFNLKNHYSSLGESILVCVTETKTDADLSKYVDAINKK